MQTKTTTNFIKTLFLLSLLLFNLTTLAQMQQQVNNKLILPNTSYQMRFAWQGDSVNHSFEKHSALLIPVKLSGCPKTFYMQFDLGAPYSLFYQKKLQAIISKYPKTKASLKSNTLAAATFALDHTTITATAIYLRDFGNGEIDWNSNKAQIIGTVGVDIFDGQTLVIDYPKEKLTIAAAPPLKLIAKASFTPFMYMQRSILLPALVQGKQTMLFFDTGSSRYALLTNEKTAKSMAIADSPVITSRVSSWDRVLTANTLATAEHIVIAGHQLPLKNVTYMQGASSAQVDMMMKLGIGGMTGNKLFLNYQLILDTKNKKMALME